MTEADIIGEISQIEPFAKGTGVHIRPYLNRQYVRCINHQGNEASLSTGAIYRALPTTPVEDDSGMLRIIDNEGEDYL